jgi:hypothetical protein
MYTLVVGLEHLRSGIEFEAEGNLSFWPNGKTCFLISSLQPFRTIWRVVDSNTGFTQTIKLNATRDGSYDLPTPETTSRIREIVQAF